MPGNKASTLPDLAAAGHIGPSALIAAIMTVLAVSPGIGAARVVVFAAAALLGQLSIGWSNDYFDAPHDAAAGRRDKPVVAAAIPRSTIGAAGGLALVANIALCFVLSPFTGAVNLIMMAAGWAYNAGLKSTLLSGVTYVVGFGLIPTFAFSVRPGQPAPPPWLVAAAALLGLGGHFANVLPDLDRDRAAGINGLPQRVAAARPGPAGARVITIVLLVAAAIVLAVAIGSHHRAYAVGAIAITLGAAVVGVRGRGRAPFIAAMVIAAVDVALVVASRDATG